MKKILNVLFEKLHRYVFDYCYQSINDERGKSKYNEKNKSNKLENYNTRIKTIYNALCPYFIGWRDNLPKQKKYIRYGGANQLKK